MRHNGGILKSALWRGSGNLRRGKKSFNGSQFCFITRDTITAQERKIISFLSRKKRTFLLYTQLWLSALKRESGSGKKTTNQKQLFLIFILYYPLCYWDSVEWCHNIMQMSCFRRCMKQQLRKTNNVHICKHYYMRNNTRNDGAARCDTLPHVTTAELTIFRKQSGSHVDWSDLFKNLNATPFHKFH